MEFFLLLIIGAFLFSFVGVLVLLGKTNRQEERIGKLERIIEGLTDKEHGGEKIPADAPAAGSAASPWAPPAFDKVIPRGEITLPQAPGEFPASSGEVPAPSGEFPQPSGEFPAASGEFPASSGEVPASSGEVLRYAVDTPKSAAQAKTRNRLADAIYSFVKGGNLWAAGGVVLLLAGFGALINYLGRRGFFTVEMGIAAAVAAGVAMILLGWRFRVKRPMYFIILQGGGIGILYLAVFAAHKLTVHLSLLPALVLMSVLIPPAVILALFQNSQGLAVLSFAGGFAAPLLLSGGGGNHLFLFSYYAVLNCGVFVIGFFRGVFRSWKGLNLLAFSFTFITSLAWTMTAYKPEFLASTEPFFLVFILFFTVLGLRSLRNQDYRFEHYSDIILILGTPAAAALLQWKVFSFVEHGYAVIALVFSAFYLLLTIAILKKGNRAMKGYAEAYLALGALLANIAVPLELSPGISGALWAAEGAVLFFVGLRAKARNWKGEISAETSRSGDPRLMAAGIAVHIAAAIAFVCGMATGRSQAAAWRSPAFSGSLIIAVSALFIAAMAEKLRPQKKEEKISAFSLSVVIWGFAWWFGGWFFELRRVLPEAGNAFLVLASVSGALSWAAVVFFRIRIFAVGIAPAPLLAAFTVLKAFGERSYGFFYGESGAVFTYNFFAPSRISGWLTFFGLHALGVLLLRVKTPFSKTLKKDAEPAWLWNTRIFITLLTAMAVLSASGRFYTREAGLSVSWTSLAGLLPLFALLAAFPFVRRMSPSRGQWSKLLFPVLPFILSGILALWFLVTLFLPGDPSPLPLYIPVLNPLDLLEGLCIASVVFWQIKENNDETGTGKEKNVINKTGLIVLCDISVFFWIASILARSVHYYGDIPWHRTAGSDAFQLCLFIFWAFYGIFHIILGHRKKKRVPWIAGAVLVTADIAKLILLDMSGISAIPRILSFFAAGIILLFIGWAAPLPPSRISHEEDKL